MRTQIRGIELMAGMESAPESTDTQRKLRWRKPRLTLDTMVNATGADLNAPGDDGQTIYPGIDLGNYS